MIPTILEYSCGMIILERLTITAKRNIRLTAVPTLLPKKAPSFSFLNLAFGSPDFPVYTVSR